jgi:hypothetical protein
MKTEAVRSSKTLVTTHKSVRRDKPQGQYQFLQRCEHLRSHVYVSFSKFSLDKFDESSQSVSQSARRKKHNMMQYCNLQLLGRVQWCDTTAGACVIRADRKKGWTGCSEKPRRRSRHMWETGREEVSNSQLRLLSNASAEYSNTDALNMIKFW